MAQHLNPLTPQHQQAIHDLTQTARRNEAIADLMNWKKYLPNELIASTHNETYQQPMKWYAIPGIGKYNSFELRFHNDYNWLISACIEFKKYEHANPPGSVLDDLFKKILHFKLIDINIEAVWMAVSDYALLVNRLKQKESKK